MSASGARPGREVDEGAVGAAARAGGAEDSARGARSGAAGAGGESRASAAGLGEIAGRMGPRRSLRTRLALAFALITALVQALGGVAILAYREGTLITNIDGLLRRAVVSAEERAGGGAGSAAETARGVSQAISSPGTISALVLGEGGEVLARSEELAGVEERLRVLRPGESLTLESGAGGGGGGERLRVTAHAVASAGGPLTAVVAWNLSASDMLTGQLRRALALSTLVGVAGAGLAGWAVAGAITRRLRRVTEAVRAVEPGRSPPRLDAEGPEDEVRAMARELEALLSRLAAAHAAQDRFMADVSHELKTPVAALFTQAQVLRYARPDPSALTGFVRTVEEETRRLGTMVESFLLLTRMAQGKRQASVGAVYMNDVALDAVTHASLSSSQRGVSIRMHLHEVGDDGVEAVVRGDAELLRIALDNLIRNAVSFSREGQVVEVTVGVEGERVQVRVRDHGPGIPPDLLGRIFERFAQGSTQAPGRKGTGLGLAICRGIVDLHEGEIGVRNSPDGGAEFTIGLKRGSETAGGT